MKIYCVFCYFSKKISNLCYLKFFRLKAKLPNLQCKYQKQINVCDSGNYGGRNF